ncbi:MAG: hypothetical protein ACKODT_08090, partial [Fluviibacter sp.]
MQNVKMDNQRTFGHFLNEAWKAITKQQGTGKGVDDAVAALSALSDLSGEAYYNAQDATDFQYEIIKSGSNLIKNPGFENNLFDQAVGSFVTEQAHSGTKSLRIIGNGSFTAAYTLLSTDSTPRNLTVAPGEIFYAEVWVRGAPSNTQTQNGAGGIRMVFQPYSGTNQALDPSVFTIAASTAINDNWEQLAGYVTMPPTAKYLTIKLELTPAVELGEKYYFDDVIVREVTLASAANAAAGTAQTAANSANANATDAQTYAGEVVEAGTNLIKNPGFETGRFAQLGSSFSTEQAHSGSKSLKIVANGLTPVPYTLLSDGTTPKLISTAAGDIFQAEVWVRGKSGNSNSSGGFDAVQMVFQPLSGAGLALDTTIISAPASSGLNTDWVKLTGYATMPTGAKSLLIKLQVTAAVTALNAYYFDDVVVREITVAQTATVSASTANQTADAAKVNLQSTVDGVHQATVGGTQTNNAPATVKTNLKKAWSGIWHGLNGDGSITTEDKLPADVHQVGLGTRNKANDAFLNAGTADGKATLAQTNLDRKAKDFSNLAAGSDFEGASQPWTLQDGWALASDQKQAGSNSLKNVSGAALAAAKLNNDDVTEVKPTDQFYVEFWARRSAACTTADATQTAYRLAAYRNTGTVFGSLYFAPSDLAADTWVKRTATFDVPDDGTTGVFFRFIGLPVGGAGAVWIDNIVIRRVVKADSVGALPQDKVTGLPADLTQTKNDIQTTADGVHQGVNGGTGSGTPGTVVSNLKKAWSNIWYGLNKNGVIGTLDKIPGDVFTVALLTRNNADQGILDAGAANNSATQAKSLTKSVVASGSNLVPDPGFENSNFYLYASEGASRHSTDNKYVRNGIYSLKFTTNGTNNRASYFLTDNDSEAYVPCTPGDVFYVEAWVKGASSNTATTGSIQLNSLIRSGSSAAPTTSNVVIGSTITPAACKAPTNTTAGNDWTKLSGSLTIPAGAYEWTPFFVIKSDVASGQVFYLDDVVVRETTAGSNAQTAASNAQTTATNAQDALKSALASGPNLVFDGGFENLVVQASPTSWASGARSTEQKRTGAYSWKHTCSGSVNTYRLYVNNDRTTSNWPTSGGKKYYYEAWVYPASANQHLAGYISLHSEVTQVTGASTTYAYPGINITLSTLTKGAWNKVSGTLDFTSYTDAVSWYAYLRTDAACSTGDVFYWDDVRIVDVTEAYDAQATANTANTAAGKAVDYIASGTNLIPDPGFESAARDAERLANASVTNQYSHNTNASFKRSGSRSLKCAWASGQPGMYFSPTLSPNETIPTRAGATFK